jgi:hypothetical protein
MSRVIMMYILLNWKFYSPLILIFKLKETYNKISNKIKVKEISYLMK